MGVDRNVVLHATANLPKNCELHEWSQSSSQANSESLNALVKCVFSKGLKSFYKDEGR